MKLFTLLVIVAAIHTPLSAESLKAPTKLLSDGEASRLGGSASPKLTWIIESDQRGIEVSAYQVLVASSESLLEEGKADLWDSKKVDQDRNPGLIYEGKELSAGTSCHWKVRWWAKGNDTPSPWSTPATWEVAPQKPADWQGAKWMDDGRKNPENEADFYKPDPAPLMRHEFEISKPITRARLHIAGIGLCLPSLNGEEIADHVFDPPWTNFDKRILFRTHDVTKQLEEGNNCLGLELGNGWYNPLPLRMWGHRNIRGSIPLGRPRAIALLVIDHPDGTSTTVTSSEKWKMTQSATLRNSIYLGEERDAQLEVTDWNTHSFDASSWKPVNLVEATLETLQALRMPPVRLIDPLEAKSVNTLSPGLHIVDFGVNFTGIPEVKINAPAGTKITFRFGELLHENGSLNPMTSVAGQIKGMKKDAEGNPIPKGGPGAPEYAWQQNVYITKGGGEVFKPKFTYHGFRYMEISGLEEAPTTSDIHAYHFHTDLDSAGTFTSSDDLLNEIQEICRRTFLANVVTVQSDCPHRERFGYGGDIVATSEAYLMNFDMAGFYAKTVRDWSDAAQADGNFTDTAPFVGIQYCGVGWAMVHPLLMEQLYQHYADKRLIEKELPAAIRWFNLEASKRENGLVMKGLGDHESLKRIAGPVITTPMFIETAKRMARLCRIVDDSTNAKRFEKMAVESAKAWTAEFLDEASGTVGDRSQTAQVLALAWATLPEAAQEKVFKVLLDDLAKDPKNPALTTGIFGTHQLLEELSKRNRSDIAHKLATRKTFPSWGWMLENGATTLWEDWKGTDNVKSHSHPMFGSISGWFFRWLGGIQVAPDSVGFDRILIRPQTVEGLDWVKTSHESIRGTIVSNWKVTGDSREFEITIPTTATATVHLPARPNDTITEGDKPLANHPEIKVAESTEFYHHMELSAGTYRFTIR
ncbi:MAG: family 78 glycoside hydrolase catalytic domain [Akkermansiaceae bacterium]